jgi:hypothetical protein
MTRIADMSVQLRSSSCQRGQALVEVVLSMLLVLIPMFLIGWALYAHGQARNTALNGARYAAWERTVWRDPGQKPWSGAATRSTGEIENLMIERFFVRPDAPIQSTYAPAATNANLPSFYSLHNGDKVIDIERKAGEAKEGEGARPTLTLAESSEKTSTVATIYGGIAGFMKMLGGGSGMELEDQGLYVAKVDVKLNAVRHLKVFEDLNLTISERAAVVTDAWSAGGVKHEVAIVEPLVPASLLQDLTQYFGMLEEWAPFAEFEPGCVRGDVVPKDMLPSGTAQVGGVCKK